MTGKRRLGATVGLGMGLALAMALVALARQAAPGAPSPAPAANTHTAPPPTSVSITNDEPISAATVTSRTFAVHAMQSGLVTGVHAVVGGGNTIVVTPAGAFHAGELIYATATTATLGTSGAPPTSPTVWQFTLATQGKGRGWIPQPVSPAGAWGRRIALGDVDGDRDVDAVVPNYAGHTAVYLNDGNGHVSAHPISPTFGPDLANAVALGDVDGDGDLDAVLAFHSEPQRVYLNDGTGRFCAHPISPTFAAGFSTDITLGDMDGDGDLDAVVANTGNEPQDVYLNDGSGGFSAHPVSPTFGAGSSFGVALGDLNGDGSLDAVVANYNNEPRQVYVNDGTGRLAPHPTAPTLAGYNYSYDVALGDVDGDGDLDAVAANAYANLPQEVYLNDGSGQFTAHPISPTFGAGDSRAIALGDLDGDGDLDAAVANYNGETQAVFLNDGSGGFAGSAGFGAGDSFDIVLGDLNSDGDLDAAVSNFEAAGALTVWLHEDWRVYLPLVLSQAGD